MEFRRETRGTATFLTWTPNGEPFGSAGTLAFDDNGRLHMYGAHRELHIMLPKEVANLEAFLDAARNPELQLAPDVKLMADTSGVPAAQKTGADMPQHF